MSISAECKLIIEMTKEIDRLERELENQRIIMLQDMAKRDTLILFVKKLTNELK